jgi:hypothetical protein
MPFNLALDPDLGPDPSPGSVEFQQILSFNPDFGPVVVFLDCPLHRGHHAFSRCGARMTVGQSGKVRIRVLADEQIQTLVPDPCLTPQTAYRTF